MKLMKRERRTALTKYMTKMIQETSRADQVFPIPTDFIVNIVKLAYIVCGANILSGDCDAET